MSGIIKTITKIVIEIASKKALQNNIKVNNNYTRERGYLVKRKLDCFAGCGLSLSGACRLLGSL
jgi:hypothetical protein